MVIRQFEENGLQYEEFYAMKVNKDKNEFIMNGINTLKYLSYFIERSINDKLNQYFLLILNVFIYR